MATKQPKLGLLDKVFVGLLLVIFGGIVLHAPLSVGFSALFPSAEIVIKSWKEILLLFAIVVGIASLVRRKQTAILKQPLILLIAAYVALHLLLLPLEWNGVLPAAAGLLIDLRYLVFFVLVYLAVSMYPTIRRTFLKVFVAGALVVLGFAILQVTVLPNDTLRYLGYGESSIMPYLTVDENPDYVRISSTLRGPNPLGAYAAIVLTLLIAFGMRGYHGQFKRPMFIVGFLGVGSLVALWASYSRSALVGAIFAIVLVLLLTVGRRLSKWVWVSAIVVVMAISGGLIAARSTDFVSNVILHENATTGASVSSNEGHIDSLSDGVNRMVHQPLGGGIGSTGSASLYGTQPLIIENQYLFIAHEAGWIGLALFLYISYKIYRGLWQRRKDWLALGVLASGIGLALIGILLPVWVDDTVAIIWWGLAAIALGGLYERPLNKTSKRTA